MERHFSESKTSGSVFRFGTWYLVLITAFLLASCEEDYSDVPEIDDSSDADERFGVIANRRLPIKQWSALWHMSQYGSIEFCVKNTRSTQEKRAVEEDARRAVNEWIALLNQGRPDSSYPAWSRNRIDVRFGCGKNSYTIAMFNGRSNCAYWDRKINLDYDYDGRQNVVAHEFGHSMGLADTYSYSGGMIRYQPDSMMQKAQRFTDDDRKGIWALWNYIVTGDMRCGPGYVQASGGNTSYDELCKPGSSQGNDQGQDQGSCRDSDKNCGSWAQRGYCTNSRYKSWMKTNCCESCSGDNNNNDDNNNSCRDSNQNCGSWARRGYCTDSRYRTWMRTNCCQSCSR